MDVTAQPSIIADGQPQRQAARTGFTKEKTILLADFYRILLANFLFVLARYFVAFFKRLIAKN